MHKHKHMCQTISTIKAILQNDGGLIDEIRGQACLIVLVRCVAVASVSFIIIAIVTQSILLLCLFWMFLLHHRNPNPASTILARGSKQ